MTELVGKVLKESNVELLRMMDSKVDRKMEEFRASTTVSCFGSKFCTSESVSWSEISTVSESPVVVEGSDEPESELVCELMDELATSLSSSKSTLTSITSTVSLPVSPSSKSIIF